MCMVPNEVSAPPPSTFYCIDIYVQYCFIVSGMGLLGAYDDGSDDEGKGYLYGLYWNLVAQF